MSNRRCKKCGSLLLYASDYCITCEIAKEYEEEQSSIGFKIGETLYGFCSGYFGRDSYDNKVVECFGKDWVVCRGENGLPQFARFYVSKHFWKRVDEWRSKGE